MKKRFSPILPVALAVGLACPLASAQSVDLLIVNKVAQYDQLNATTVAPAAVAPYQFNAGISGTGLTAAYPAVANFVTAPGGSPVALPFNGDNWDYIQSFASLAALDAAYANGTYTLAIGANSYGVSLTGDTYANTPLITASAGIWNSGVLTISAAEAAAGLTFFTNTFTTHYAGDGSSRVGFNIQGQNIGYSAENETFAADSLTTLIAGGALTAGKSYRVQGEFNKIVSFTDASATHAGAQAIGVYSTVSAFTLTVIPEPSTYAFAGFAAFALVARRKRAKR